MSVLDSIVVKIRHDLFLGQVLLKSMSSLSIDVEN